MNFIAEQRLARLRPRTSKLFLPTVALFAAVFLLSFFTGRLNEQWQNIALWVATGAIALILWLIPLLRYLSQYIEITNVRVLTRSGLMGQHRDEARLSQVNKVELTGGRTITLHLNGEEPMVLTDVPKHKMVAAEIQALTASK
jgi:membrane protein YdbS with pleckstrin-like domain